MSWIESLLFGQGVAQSVFWLAVVATLGIGLGRVRIGRVSLGGAMVLFIGLFFGYLGIRIEAEVLHFIKELGLILFVYAVGLQVGPGFFSSFKKGGVRLNLLAGGVVALGVLTTIGLFWVTGLPMPTMVGILSGAVTNTPGLGAAQTTYIDMSTATEALAETIPLGYAVTYPLGVMGIILAIMLIRWAFAINERQEEELLKEQMSTTSGASSASFELTNPNLEGKTIGDVLSKFSAGHIVISRHLNATTGQIAVATPQTILHQGDRVFAVADESTLVAVELLLGKRLEIDRRRWIPTDSTLVSEVLVISNKELTGRRLGDLNLLQIYGVTVPRITRAGLDFVPHLGVRLQVGDKLRCVGSDVSVAKIRAILGDSTKHLNEPNLLGVFLGIALGILLGLLPLHFPGIPQPVKLGLAGGPLIVAILLSRFGVKLHLVTFMTQSANLMLRELGITLFLACVGLGAGSGFVDTILGGGYVWIFYGFLITILPLLIMGTIGRKLWGLDFFTLSGALSGAMTDPPALAYASSLTEGDTPAMSYATVYPLTMFLRVLTAQLLILLFCS